MTSNTTVYVVTVDGGEQEVTTMKEVKSLLGDSSITKREILAGTVPNAHVKVDPEVEAELAKMETQPTEETTGEVPEDNESTDTEDVDYPEVGHFTEKKDLQKFYKKLSIAQLEEWVELEGLGDNIKPTDSEPIYRMRLCMAILYHHFPKQPAAKKKSKYADYSTEDLVQIALDNDVDVKDAKGDERIQRMYTIMALRTAGLLA